MGGRDDASRWQTTPWWVKLNAPQVVESIHQGRFECSTKQASRPGKAMPNDRSGAQIVAKSEYANAEEGTWMDGRCGSGCDGGNNSEEKP